MDFVLPILVIILVAPCAFFLGKWTDIYWRIKIKRQFMKKDYHIAEIVSKDKKSKTQQIFLPEQSTIWHKGEIYTVESNRIYRTSKPDDGFYVNQKNITWREGIPIITINEDTFRPLDYDFGENIGATAGEVGAILKSWVVNQAAKAIVTAFAGMKQAQMFMMIIMAVCVLCLLVSGLLYMEVTKIVEVLPVIHQNAADISMLKGYIIPPNLQNVTGG